jgi:ABC-2 type transport system permease protein
MLAIFKREVKAYFYSPIAYVLIGLFILISSVFFFMISLFSQSAEVNNVLSNMGFLLIFIVPILTMKVLAEDRKNGTEVLLLTSPSSLTGVVVGKYLATLLVYLVMIAVTLVYPIILFIFGKPAIPPMLGGYLGIILLGATLIAIGVFISSLTENQVIAAVISFVTMLILAFLQPISSSLGGNIAKALNWLSIFFRYDDFNKGILDLSSVIYYLSFIAVFLFLTVRVIEKRRWSQG